MPDDPGPVESPSRRAEIVPGVTTEDYIGRWVKVLPGGARLVRVMWLRRTTTILESGEIIVRVTPLGWPSAQIIVPTTAQGRGLLTAATSSSGGGSGGSSLSMSGGGSGGGGGGGGGGSGGASAAKSGSNEGEGAAAPSADPAAGAPDPDPLDPAATLSLSGSGVATFVAGGSKRTPGQPAASADPSSAEPEPDPPGPTARPNAVPMTYHVDGRFGGQVVVPADLFDVAWVTNLTQSEIGGAGVTVRGRGLYPKGSLRDFDLVTYLDALDQAVRLHVPESAVGIGALDFEGGLYPWAGRGNSIFSEGLSDAEFERLVHRFFIESLRTAKAARPNVRWSFWGYPHSWESEALIDQIRDIYAEFDALSPGMYITNSGDEPAIRSRAERLGRAVAKVRAQHPLGAQLPTAVYVWHRYSSVDRSKPYLPVSVDDFVAATRTAEPWTDLFVMWMGAGSPGEAEQVTDDLGENGHIRNLVEASRAPE